MRPSFSRFLILSAVVAASTVAQQSNGPDVIVGDLTSPSSYGTSGGIAAYAVGTDSCNIGNAVIQWQGGTNLHPVIGQNAYRLKGGKFEQVGMSWLKHGFTALAGSLCNTCQNPGTGSLLGVGCSDPYSSGLNGGQSGLGPRSEVNPATGVFLYPFGGNPVYDATIGRRLQVAVPDADPAQNAGAVYFFEAQYVTQDDATAGNKNNNCSYRRCSFGTAPNYTASYIGATVRQQSALYGWRSIDPSVTITNVDFPNDGRFETGYTITPLGGGLYRYVFCVHNLSSDLAGRAFQVNFTNPTSITNLYFRDVPYHSGEPYDGTDWSASLTSTSVKWETALWCTNPNANALRWGTSYTFGFDAGTSAFSSTQITPFKPTSNCPAQPTVPQIGSYSVNTNAPYTFVDISTTGTAGPVGDDASITVNVGFPFPFFGSTLTQLKISTNGYLCQTSSSGTVYQNTTLPNAADPNGVIAGNWGDLFPTNAANGSIFYKTQGSAPNRQFIVEWLNVAHYANNALHDTFELILNENGEILNTMVATAGSAGFTRGLENPTGTVGVSSSGPYTANTTWLYTYTPTILPSADIYVSGNGAANTTLTIQVVSTARQAAVILLASTNPGPTPIPPYGSLQIGLATAIPLVDGMGIFMPADPAARTNCECGSYSLPIPIPAPGLPPGLSVYFEGAVFWNSSGPTPPNGVFHYTPAGVLNT